MGFEIIGTGSHHPSNKVTNNDFKGIETSDEWIYTRTGIKSRYITDNETTSTLALESAKKAISDANIDVNDIKIVITATMTPDSFTPNVSSKILMPLGITKACAFDINVACSGFVYALSIAENMLKDNEYALVIGSECVSKILDFKDRSTCVLFGDGAGAVIIKKSNNKFDYYLNSKTDVDGILEAPGFSQILGEDNTITDFKLRMNGKEVFKFALDCFCDCIDKLNEKGISMSDVDLIIPHQANKRIIQSVSRRYEIDEEKFYLNLEDYGNTSAASIAIALDEANKAGKIKKGMKLLLVGFGSGLSWGYIYIEL